MHYFEIFVGLKSTQDENVSFIQANELKLTQAE